MRLMDADRPEVPVKAIAPSRDRSDAFDRQAPHPIGADHDCRTGFLDFRAQRRIEPNAPYLTAAKAVQKTQ